MRVATANAARILCAAMGAACCSSVALPASAAESAVMEPPLTIRDLHYGDVLFQFFQDDYYEALVRIGAYGDTGRLPQHAADAELLSGGLFLSLGMLDDATQVFNRLLAGPVPAAVADQANFYVAKIAHRRGRLVQAEQCLARIHAPLQGELEYERQLLVANVLMAQGRHGEAVDALKNAPHDTAWAAYARFNLGVAMVRSGDVAAGRALLEQVGTRSVRSEERRSLQDRANLALGYSQLQDGSAEAAVVALNRVRLDGPFTARALLGLGWAQSQAGRPEQALVPWLELRQRSVLDPSVQESHLAVPYAYTLLASNGQAAAQYRTALEAYADERQRLDESIAALHRDGFLDALVAQAPRDEGLGWYWQLEQMPDAPHTRYLYSVLASHAFQEGLRNYRDLQLMRAKLMRWRDSLIAFDEMIATRERASMQREPRRINALQQVDAAPYRERREALAATTAQIEASRDVAALADRAAAAQWTRLSDLAQRVEALPAGAQRETLTERTRLLRGSLLWRFDAGYKQGLHHLQAGLREVDAALAGLDRGMTRVAAAGAQAQLDTAGLAARNAALAARLETLQPRFDAVATRQERALAALAIDELEAQKSRLASYATQAQFALASLLDRATVAGGP